jgi:hypothetical protein
MRTTATAFHYQFQHKIKIVNGKLKVAQKTKDHKLKRLRYIVARKSIIVIIIVIVALTNSTIEILS